MLISSLLTKSVPWRRLHTRTLFTSRPTFISHPLPKPDPPSSDAKLLDSFTEEFEVGAGRIASFQTGKLARFANGAVVMGMGQTNVISTVTCSKSDSPPDFLPLTVDYQEKHYAKGVIPNTFMRREGAPKERELLVGRLIDRPIRPLFPAGFYHEVQVMASVLSSDGTQDPDVMAANATSAALMLSDVPWGGPIGVVRIGRICGQFVVNPTMDELSLSDLNLVYACTKDKTLMIDVQAREISENDLKSGLRLAHPEAVKFLEPQIRLASKAGKQKKEYKLSMMHESTMEKIKNLSESRIEAIFSDPTYGKFERGEALDMITQDVRKSLEEDCDEERLKGLSKAVDAVRKQIVRRRILKEESRVDGRHLDEVRPVYCEAGNLPALHGSSIFSRGETQVLCTITLGAPGDAQRLESVVGPSSKRFMLHYSFPPFSINEVGKRTGLNRREVGHGTLAEKALLAVLPPENDFPYTVRVNSEVMASDGSTSMASVCGGSLALMDAGIPVREHVAGVSVGLVSEVDPISGKIVDYRILTDILGLEDHLGDIDFKIAGTRNGVTAIQLDMKPAGIPLDIICECFEPALRGRLQILDHMDCAIRAPRTPDERTSRRIVTLKYSNDSIRRLIGPLGCLKAKIEEETGARISVGNETLTILCKNQSAMDKVQDKIDFIIGGEIEVGRVYKGVVSSVKEYGAFVEFNGGQQGLLHISELSHEPVSRVSDVVSMGEHLSVMCIGQDVRGNVKVSLKAMLPQPKKNDSYEDDGSASTKKPSSHLWASVGDTSNSQGKQTSIKEPLVTKYNADKDDSSTSNFVIRSAAECDEKEKLDSLRKDKTTKSSADKDDSPTSNFLIRSAAECDEKEKLDSLRKDKTTKSSAFSRSPVSSLRKDKTTNSSAFSRSPVSSLRKDKTTKSYAFSRSPVSNQSTAKDDFSTTLNILLGSAAERDGEKKLGSLRKDKTTKSSVSSSSPVAVQSTAKDDFCTSIKFLIRSAAECDEKEKLDSLRKDKTTKSSAFSSSPVSLKSTTKDEESQNKCPSSIQDSDSDVHPSATVNSINKTTSDLSARNLKVGSVVDAKVYQIRSRGLVLDLGGGLKGMYRFQGDDKEDFEVGDKLKVRCSSFTDKRVPVMSKAMLPGHGTSVVDGVSTSDKNTDTGSLTDTYSQFVATIKEEKKGGVEEEERRGGERETKVTLKTEKKKRQRKKREKKGGLEEEEKRCGESEKKFTLKTEKKRENKGGVEEEERRCGEREEVTIKKEKKKKKGGIEEEERMCGEIEKKVNIKEEKTVVCNKYSEEEEGRSGDGGIITEEKKKKKKNKKKKKESEVLERRD